MAAQLGTIEWFAQALGEAISFVARELSLLQARDWLSRFGVALPQAFFDNPAFKTPRATMSAAAQDLNGLLKDLADAAEQGDTVEIIAKGLAVIDQVSAVIQSFSALQSGISTSAAGLGIPANRIANLVDNFPQKLLDMIVTEQADLLPALGELLTFIGLIQRQEIPADPNNPLLIEGEIPHLNLGQIGALLSNPQDTLKNLYDWGKPGFDGSKLFPALSMLLLRSGLPAFVVPPHAGQPIKLDAIAFDINAVAGPPPGIDVVAAMEVDGSIDLMAPYLPPDWSIRLKSSVAFPVGTKISLRAPFDLSITPPSGKIQGNISVTGTGQPATPYLLFGTSGASRLEIASVSVTADLGLAWNTATGRAAADPSFEAKVAGGRLVIDESQGDGFIQKLLSGVHIDAAFAFGAGLDLAKGFYFEGSSALEIAVPTHIDLGPVSVSKIYLVFGLDGGDVTVELSADLGGSLGPITAMVERVGLLADLSFPPNGGNLGPLDLGFAFKPPNGVGLSVDAGIVAGGGYLSIDTQRGQYSGVLQLVFADFLTVTAIGLIQTKMPDGSDGFSLLLIITADFGSGIQLGFGFTLNAVGGLIGVNRGMLFQPIMDGVRTDAIESVMFPQDVIANAPRIISDLQAFFPAQEGTFLIGPMAKLGWGEPTLVSLSLGVIVEIPPGDIAILGVLKLALPAEDIAILELQVNFAGALEFDKQRMYFYASLYDSHILFITIDGSMGLLFAYGDDANFVVSIGGFHPQYNPPPLPFPTPTRISIDILNESFARIHCDGYFAVTSNSVQFGTHADFFFGFSALSVEGAAGFDALIQFSPFHFSVSISASFSVKVFGLGLFGIGISVTLEGPTPWHANGTASLTILFFSVDIGIEFTWGDSRNTTLPPVAVMPLLTAELNKQSNWRALPPTSSNLFVSLRKLDEADVGFVLHPVGKLQVSQRLVPLDLTLDKFGNQQPTDSNRFSLTVSSAGLTKTRNLQEQFAPAQFINTDDAGKLSQPAYVPQHSGLELAVTGIAYASGTAITRIVRYDLTIIDTALRRSLFKFFMLAAGLFNHFLRGSSVARNRFSAFQAAQTHPFDGTVTISPETFSVALKSNNTLFRADAAAFTSQVAANDFVSRAVAKDPTLADTLHVVPQFEMAA
jgi:hypothetical protein